MAGSILITGGSGFLGSNLIEFFILNTDYRIFSISREEIEVDHPPERFISVKHDLSNPLAGDLKAKLGEVEYIIHLAGSSDVKKSVEFPVDTFKNNVITAINLLEFARLNIPELKQFLFFSTAEVFGPSEDNKKFKEDDRHNPHSPYAASKSAAQEICLSYFRSYELPVLITHVMNIYGKFQVKDKFISKMIRMISSGEKVSLHASGGPDKRNYLHVQDICDSIFFLMRNGTAGEKYNIVSETDTDNLEIAMIISKILNKDLNYKLVRPTPGHKHHTLSLLDGSKLREMGWKSKIPLETGLRDFINNE